MIKEKGCQCFSCQNSDNIDRIYGYYYGCYEVYSMIVQQLKKYGIKEGSIGDDNLEGLLACCSCNMEDVGCLLAETENKLKEVK